mmetsp:Transcript_101336/g.180114  ORF Transcript_101336/g.180114 Transcript_101336/m.180114 type:complete len:533 (-) Transcript_101336:112-1710(-)
MDQPRGPRANRSKKTLPAAFFSQQPRHTSPHVGAGGASVGGERPQDWSPRLAPGVRRPSNGGLESASGGESPPFPPEGFDHGHGAVEGIRLDALVFLSSCPQRHGHFAIKKMLHPPTLELFCLLEIPGAEHQRAVLRDSLQAWLSRWSELQVECPGLLVSLREAFWDAPQGYPMAILCEYMPLGSLDDLIQACGGLPEESMREIAQVLLQALNALHSSQPPVVHGCLKPSQVLFTSWGQPRLTFGLEQRIKACQVVAAASGGVAVDGAEVPGHHQPEQSTAVDIFDLGLLLLVSALGGMDVLMEAIPYARKFGSQNMRGPGAPLSAVSGDTCSLLLNELRGGSAGEVGAGSDMGYLPPASDLLFNRHYSGPFLAFVSTCLEAHTQSTPVSARDLLEHEFLLGQAQEGPLVSLREMQGLARVLNEAPEHDPSRWGPATRRSLVPGVAPSVAQSAQLYLMNIAQSIAPHCSWSAGGIVPRRPQGDTVSQARPRWQAEEWETLLTDTARTLGLSKNVVQSALEAQLERLLQISAR